MDPLAAVVVGEDLEWHLHQIGQEGAYASHHSQALLIGSIVVPLDWGEGTADETFLSVLALSKDSTKTLVGGICIQLEGEVEVGEGSDKRGSEMLL